MGRNARGAEKHKEEPVAACVQNAVVQLAEAHDYAQDVEAEPWQYAVEIGNLKAVGASDSDLRWLAERGYVEHAREVTRPGDASRRFAPPRGACFAKRTCFILTKAGLRLTSVTSCRTPRRRAA
jgi:hypothetical protein